MSSMAAPVRRKGEPPPGVVIIAGTSWRLTVKRDRPEQTTLYRLVQQHTFRTDYRLEA